MKTRKLRLLSALLALAMLFALTPTAAFAAGASNVAFTCEKDKDGNYTITGVYGSLPEDGVVVIPGKIDNKPVTTIGSQAFMNNATLTKVTIPASVTKIEGGYMEGAFRGCTNLTEVVLAENSQLQNIGTSAFYKCVALESINLEAATQLESIGESAFNWCIRLEGISLPESGLLSKIETDTFYGTALKNVTIPATITEIGQGAFASCSSLTSITFAPTSQLKTIRSGAFASTSLTTITIPASVQEIKSRDKDDHTVGAFMDCSKLQTVFFEPGGQLTTLENDTFEDCTSLQTVYYDGGNREIEELLKKEVGHKFQSAWIITFEVDGSAVLWKSVKNGQTVTKPDNLTPTKEGYTFAWYTKDAEGNYAAEAFDFENTPITENTTLTAKWNINQYTVTFDAQGGEDEPANQTVDYNGTATEPAAPTKTGYTFGGWYADEALTTAFDFTAPITKDTTVYAKWLLNSTPLVPATPVTYKVTVENGTARVLDENGNELVKEGESVTVQVGKTVTIKAADFSDSNMKFDRWEVRKGEVKLANDHAAETTFTMPAEDVELEVMLATADTDDSSWDTATVVTGVVLGTGTAVLAYHIGMEVYAEQVLGKGVAVPKTRAEVALLAWQLAGKPEVAVEGEPLSEAAQAQQWAVESGLMQNDADGSFNPDKKMSKWKALRTLDAAKKMG